VANQDSWAVECINGHAVDDETPSTPADARKPCPTCGTLNRHVRISSHDWAQATDTAVVSKVDALIAPSDLEKVERLDLRVSWYELILDDGRRLWSVAVYAADGGFIDGGVAETSDQAFSDVMLRLLPPEDGIDGGRASQL
jgi:hypothetical protein